MAARKNTGKININKEELKDLYINRGLNTTQIAKTYNVHAATIQRRINEYDITKKVSSEKNELSGLEQLTLEEQTIMKELGKLNPDEIKNVLKNLKRQETVRAKYIHSFGGTKARLGLITDLHIGSKFFDEELFYKSVKIFKQEKVDAIYCAGDIVEGMSNREGHVFELKHLGMTEQIHVAKKFLDEYHIKVHGITGNHELWATKKANQGLDAGDYLASICDNYENLGQMEADIDLGGVVMKIYHGQDGSAYAPGYRGMKLIESLSGGSKPNILFAGHTHKYLYMFRRNIHYVEGGCLQSQTEWMRGKKLMAQKGFSILDLDFSKGGIEYFNLKFYPAYD